VSTETGDGVALPMPFADLARETDRMWRRMLHLPEVAQTACRTRVGTTPHEVVFANRGLKLLHYLRETPARYAEPVVICYALVNRPYILDLLPGKSVVRQYLERGFEVYLIDWGVPSDADQGLSLADYVSGFLEEATAFVRGRHHGEKAHLVGYCMGGTMSALLAALRPEEVATLTLLAAPIDFGAEEALLHLWTDRRHFDVDSFLKMYGNCPAWFLQVCFLQMKPVQNYLEKYLAVYEQMEDQEFMSNHFAMERWINDNIPVAGATFREFVKNLYQDNELVQGRLRVGDSQVDLGRIECPLLLLTARNDHLVPPASTEGIRPHVASRDIRSITIDAGHVGLVVGGKALRTMWPEATAWLAQRSQPLV
jgi:polyhydroxyalkanoate synthase